MKIVLIQPPVRDFYDTDIRLQPVGLCYLKAVIKKHLPEVDVTVKDYHSGYKRRTVSVPAELSYLAEYYPVADKSPFSAFHQYYHFGQSFEKIENELAVMKPDVVGISALFTPYYREALHIAFLVKKRLNVPVIMGGSHVSAVPETVLTDSCVDFVIRGEGEKPIVELIKYLQGRGNIEDVPNLGYKKSGNAHLNPVEENYPVDDLPYPDLSDLRPDRYKLANKPLAFMFTSRGCPHACSFCSVRSTFGKKYRRRTVKNIIEEIEQRYEEGYRVIDFEDDNLTFYKYEFKELCRRIIEKFPSREINFTAMNGISYMSLDKELLELMHKAGFTHLNLSLVSSDDESGNLSNRPHSLEKYINIVTMAFQMGFNIVSYQIFGLPYENLENMVRTLSLQARMPVLIGASPFYLTPDTTVAKEKQFTCQDYVKARLTAMGVETDRFKKEDIYTLFLITRIINFLKGLNISGPITLNELMRQKWNDNRIGAGFELLRQLETSGILYFRTSKGKVANRKFKEELYREVLREAKYITCQNGKRIVI